MKRCFVLFKFRLALFHFQKNLKVPLRHRSFYFSNLFKGSILRNNILSHRKVMNLSSVVTVLDQIFPKNLAENWDNVGLLIEPRKDLPVETVFLTNDLTEDVMKEALDVKANLILSYHPPIFSGMKALVSHNWKDRVVMQCVANGIALYSPHTSCDAIEGGVNDWLVKCFDLKDIKPIKSAAPNVSHIIECTLVKKCSLTEIMELGMKIENILPNDSSFNEPLVKVWVTGGSLNENLERLKGVQGFHSAKIIEYKTPNAPLIGMGRVGDLNMPLSLRDCIERVKKHTGLDRIRVVVGAGKTLDSVVGRVASCAGSGASLLRGVGADLYVTGEMSHHEALDCQQRGTSVILCEHSNSERGYLALLEQQLASRLDSSVVVLRSKADRDPISIL